MDHAQALEWGVSSTSLVDDVFALFLAEHGESSPDATPDSALVLTSQAKQSKKRRRRPKDDLEQLRATARELEATLAALRISSVESDADGEGSGWREVALHQRRQVERAKEVNAQLHAVLREQSQLASELQQVLLRHMRLARIEGSVLPVTLRPAPPPTHYDVYASPTRFQSLMDELNGMRNRLKSVFKVASFDEFGSKKASMRECSLRTNGDGTFFEIHHMERFPFPAEALHRAIGAATALNSSRYPYSTFRHVDANTTQVAFSELLPNARVIMTYKMVIRRVIEKDRVVLVWVGDVELEGGMSVRLKEEGWGIAQPRKSSSTSSTSKPLPLLMRNILHVIPELSGANGVEEQRRCAGEMMDMVLDAYRWLVTLINESIENVMLMSMRGTIEASPQQEQDAASGRSVELASDGVGSSTSLIYQA